MYHDEDQSGRLQLIAFQIGERNFCIDVKNVREIRCWTPVTELPHSPEYLLGVINLRGSAIAIVDLSARLGFGPNTPNSRDAIMVVELSGKVFGLLVDAVSEIFSVDKSAVQVTPDISHNRTSNQLSGIIVENDRMLALVDLNLLMLGDELAAA